MKKQYLLFFILILLLFTSCTQSEESPEENSEEIADATIIFTPEPCADPGDAGYLIEEDFILNEDNLESCLADFFTAPCPLDFYLEDEDGGIYRCTDSEYNTQFAQAIQTGDYSVISMRLYNAVVAHGSIDSTYPEASYERAYFANALGQVSIIIGKDGTYLDFYRDVPKENEMNESGRTFFTPKNIFPDLETVKSEILPHCEPIS
ncbi:MAG: hypothetical protein IIY02_06695 [Firmicutes bacterium]|nr:hypothetical protein [Bacillota bacterium]